MKIEEIMQFTNGFGDPNSKMNQNVPIKFKAGVITSTQMRGQQENARGQRSDAKVWDIVRGLFGLGSYEVAIACAKDNSCGYAEVRNKDTGETQVAFMTITQKANLLLSFSAGIFNVSGAISDYGTGHRGTVLLAAYFGYAYVNDSEVKQTIDELTKFVTIEEDDDRWENDIAMSEKVGELIGKLSVNAYYFIKHADLSPYDVGRFRGDDKALLEQKLGAPSFGTFSCVMPKSFVGTKCSVVKGNFAYSSTPLTDEEEAMVPVMPDTYQCPQEVKTIAETISESFKLFPDAPMNVVMLSGDSGSGKSQAARAIASELGKPFLVFTCGPDTDEIDTIGTMVPNTSKESISLDEFCARENLPTLDDIDCDFADSFEKLFGEKPDALANENDCIKELIQRYSKANVGSKADFKFAYSPIITALQKGYVVEIQEPTVIKKQAVLVKLNAMLENDSTSATIQLMNGEVITRHPESVVIFTTNSDYEGCRAIQQSVLSRIDLIREMNNPDLETLVKRTEAKTKCKDKATIKKMAKFILNAASYCKDKDIRDGVVGFRELLNWTKRAMILQKANLGEADNLDEKYVCAAAYSTVIPHLSQVPEDRESIINAEFCKDFSKSNADAGRKMYEAGIA